MGRLKSPGVLHSFSSWEKVKAVDGGVSRGVGPGGLSAAGLAGVAARGRGRNDGTTSIANQPEAFLTLKKKKY
jgi:hypothetical protein